MATGLFAKRGKPAPVRRVTCRSRSGSSDKADSPPKFAKRSADAAPVAFASKRPGARARQRSPSSEAGQADEDMPAAPARRSKVKLSVVGEEDDVKAFRVKKSKMSRQMTARGAPVSVSARGGLQSVAGSERRSWRMESMDDDEKIGEADALPAEADIVSITDDAKQAREDGFAMDEEEGSDAEGDPRTGAAARLARAQRAAARELHGNAADGGGVAALQADYIPLVRPKQKVPLAADGEIGTEKTSPFEAPIEAPLNAIVAASARGSLEETDAADAWALQQMRTGAHRRHIGMASPGVDKLTTGFVQPSERDAVPVAPSQRASAPVTRTADKLQTPAQAMGRLWEALQQMEGSVGESSKKGEELDDQRNLAVDQLAEIEREVKGLDERLRVVQELEELAWAVGGLLDAKAPKTTQAAQTLAQMEQEFVTKRNRRRARDLAEDLMHFGRASLTVPLADDDVEDEELAEAAERRRVRRQRRQQRRATKEKADSASREGWDTSSMSEEDAWGELTSDRGAFCAAVHKQILGDVSEGFSMASSVLRPISAAKKRLRMEYSQAFVPMSLPEMLALHIEHSLLWWDPLEICVPSSGSDKVTHKWGPGEAVTSVQFEGFHWFEELASFTELLGDEDPDNELVPKLIQRCVFPDVLRRIRGCWDVTSARHAERIAALLDECLLFEVDQSASAYAGLLEAAIQRLEESLTEQAPEVFVANEAIPTWYASTARKRLLWRSCKIAHNAMLLDGRLPEEQLSRLVLQSIFATRIAPHLRAPRLDPEEIALVERFVSLMPERWLEHGLPPMLAPLRDALGPRAPACAEAAETAPAAVRVLHRLRCYDEAQVIMDAIAK